MDDPSVFLYATALHNPMASSRMNNLNGFRSQQNFNSTSSSYGGTSSTNNTWDRHANTSSAPSNDNNTSSKTMNCFLYLVTNNIIP